MNLDSTDLERVSADAPWENSLGMKFVSIPGTKVLFCIWLTRVRDYSTFGTYCPNIDPSWAKKTDTYGLPICETADHPVCNVSWHDAKDFCAWLTEREQRLQLRVLRGGNWTISQAVQLLSGQRFGESPRHRNCYSGFRVVLANGSL